MIIGTASRLTLYKKDREIGQGLLWYGKTVTDHLKHLDVEGLEVTTHSGQRVINSN